MARKEMPLSKVVITPSRGGLDIGGFALNNPRRIPKKRRRDGT